METIKERPILFNTEMVKAILDGRKTQTRRVIKLQPPKDSFSCFDSIDSYQGEGWFFQYPVDVGGGIDYSKKFLLSQNGKCPYGKIGDRLWVRETWFSFPTYDNLKPSKINHTESIESMQENDIDYLASPIPYYNRGKIRPSIFMPRWASRIDLEITNIRVERVQDIKNVVCNIHAEGLPKDFMVQSNWQYPIDWFRGLWDSINAIRGYEWEVNPWVWVIVFKVLSKGV